MARSAVAATAFGHGPNLLPYDTTSKKAGELIEAAIALVTEFHDLDDADQSTLGVQIRRAEAATALRGLHEKLAGVWREHHSTAKKNEGLIEEYRQLADTFAQDAEFRLGRLEEIGCELEGSHDRDAHQSRTR